MTEPDPSATTHGAPPEGSANQANDALPPLLERTIRILTESALASSHLEGDYPNPIAVRGTIERLTLESALRDLERLKELTAEHGLNRRQHTVLTFLVGGWGSGLDDSKLQSHCQVLQTDGRSGPQPARRAGHPDPTKAHQPAHHVQHQASPVARPPRHGQPPRRQQSLPTRYTDRILACRNTAWRPFERCRLHLC